MTSALLEEEEAMIPQMDKQGETSDKGIKHTSSVPTTFAKQRHAQIWYCTKCRDISLSSICLKCQKDTVLTEGTIEQYKQVGQALLNDQREWCEVLETMIIE